VLDVLVGHAATVIVVDNGSVDRTAEVARAHGAVVVREPRLGYGTACLAGLATLRDAADHDVVAFFDADGSDDPLLLEQLVDPVIRGVADLVLASRTLVPGEVGALTLSQRFGNRLACSLVSRLWGVNYTDLAPCRALSVGALNSLQMNDRDFGWTVEMQIRAARQQLRITEIPSRYRRRRGGESKISGTISGSVRAGTTILRVIGRELFFGGMRGRRSTGESTTRWRGRPWLGGLGGHERRAVTTMPE
jgi:glycosyltransferase involved in cell wall biosynthesis